MAPTSEKSTAFEAGPTSEASFLLEGVAWQDSLLQAYRNYMVVTQSIFLTAAIVLLNSSVTSLDTERKLTFAIPFVGVSLLGLLTLRYLSIALVERANAVDWWQRRLLQHEMQLKSGRHFTTFRTAKEHGFVPPDVEAHALTDEDVRTLMRPGIPKVRRVFGFFIPGFYTLWIIMLGICAITFPWARLLVDTSS